MRVAKIFLNAESEEFAIKQGRYIYAEIVREKLIKFKKEHYNATTGKRKKVDASKVVYYVRPIMPDYSGQIEKYLELRSCEITTRIQEKHIINRTFNKILHI